MSDDEDFGFNPAIAGAMGFSGFGVQPGKKRKYDANDAFIDSGAATDTNTARAKTAGQGANSLPLGLRKTGPATEGASTKQAGHKPLGPGQSDLLALRSGVKNERGDMVYFKPSFLEDPWKDLRPS
ncbi:hypothetical protein B0A55_00281 [Friedmanniomyces simplex]|uniref:Uncharacterized protein n=1 Tax=Friedmanniomyces simplex TaxID=329884 RepID=A0A4U0Y0P8_9PEZI|nr:hypothetical protein B0A55_00281 [Friedmanniomyces simplex]